MPKVFVSYSHDSDAHKEWVYELACKLVKGGVDVELDQFDAKLGASLIKFMENGLAEAGKVLVICTDVYNAKAKEGVGGVGYENIILTAALYRNQDTTKFIPCIRGVTSGDKVPPFLDGRKYIDFSIDKQYEQKFDELLADLHGVQLRPKPALGTNPFKQGFVEKQPTYFPAPSTSFFWSRMGKAFPGVRGLKWFDDPVQAVERLEILFGPNYREGMGAPIWWWRNGETGVEAFRKLSDTQVLLGPDEYEIKRIAAYSSEAYYRAFVYVETEPMPSVFEDPESRIQQQLSFRDYADEEYGLFRGRVISRQEFDDGAAEINRKAIDTQGEAKLRVRCLTKFNFLLAAQGSAINNNRFDQARTAFLKEILAGRVQVEDLAKAIELLPKRTTGAI